MILGIAGKTGAGKNKVAEILEKKGFRTLDLDIVAHRALEAMAERIDTELGGGLLENGVIQRRELGKRVFNDSNALALLEGITYPWIEEETHRWLAEKPGEDAAIHAINLHKTRLPDICDAILWVSAPWRMRRRRVMRRDGRSWNELKDRFRSQKGLGPKLFSEHAETYRVRNSGNPASLEDALDKILSRL
jgi:dephospho-CoA kinase